MARLRRMNSLSSPLGPFVRISRKLFGIINPYERTVYEALMDDANRNHAGEYAQISEQDLSELIKISRNTVIKSIGGLIRKRIIVESRMVRAFQSPKIYEFLSPEYWNGT